MALITTKEYDVGDNEYRELMRDSARLDIIKEYVKNNQYVARRDLMILLGMREEEKDA